MENLRKELDHHRHLYHVRDDPEISDSAYDSLVKELFSLEQKYPEFAKSDSPTQRIGGDPLKKFKKVSLSSSLFKVIFIIIKKFAFLIHLSNFFPLD